MHEPKDVLAAWRDAALAAQLAKRLTAEAVEAARDDGPATGAVTRLAEDTVRAAEGTAESAKEVADG